MSEWTPIEHGLPKEDGKYWVTIVIPFTLRRFCSYAYYEEGLFTLHDSDGDDVNVTERVVAWMPLPNAYNANEREK